MSQPPAPAALSAHQLTGRDRSHVQEMPGLRAALCPQAAAAFQRMRAAAAVAGIDLYPVSAFRDFTAQLTIWNAKFHGERPLLDRDGRALAAERLAPEQRVHTILLWSALPGASRHHWGSDVDVVDRSRIGQGQRSQLLPEEFAAGGRFGTLGHWLAEQAGQFGFYRPYDLDRGGVQPEPWHLSYAPIALPALEALSVPVLREAIEQPATHTGRRLAGLEVVLAALEEIHQRYVRAVAAPGSAALAAGLSPATRPS